MPSPGVEIARTIADLRRTVARWRNAGQTIALAPTMGALHEGHLALVRLGKMRCDRAVASVFVNPLQFGPHEDFSRYPRDETLDIRKLASAGCDLAWMPEMGEMYPPGFATRVEVGGAAAGLEADFRPHHFGGVATVCLKLFAATAPDAAVFGEKDYQQICVIRQMVRDFNLPLEIAALPTVREPGGLALSTRNVYLSPEERAIAPRLYRTLREAAEAAARGESIPETCDLAVKKLTSYGFSKVDYVAIRDAESLAPHSRDSGRRSRVLAAAWLGKTRLIDNVEVLPA